MGISNFPQEMVACKSALFVENGAGTYDFDVKVPAGAAIVNIMVQAEALWSAATSASLEIGDYTTADPPVAIDADGFFTAVDLKATDLTAGQHIDFVQTGGVEGAYVTLAAAGAHSLQRMDGVDRWVRARVVSVGAGTAGRTRVSVFYAQPASVTITQ